MKHFLATLLIATSLQYACSQNGALVFQTDFGLKDGAVAAMKGVAFAVSPDIRMFDLTHDIPAYNIWEAAYRLNQAVSYWPAGTVFVSVVDPGVGSDRRSIVVKTKTGHYIVTPDNGSVTLIADNLGIEEVRLIDETKNRLKNSYDSYTFHGRDVYAYTAARLTSKIISFAEVGEKWNKDVTRLPYQKATIANGVIRGAIDVLDVQYGNVWTNVNQTIFDQLKVKYGEKLTVKILHEGKPMFESDLHFGRTFADVPVGKPIAYLNSLMNFSIGINQASFANQYNIGSGPGWSIELSKKK